MEEIIAAKVPQARWLVRADNSLWLAGTVDQYDTEWARHSGARFSDWWFSPGNVELAPLVFRSHAKRSDACPPNQVSVEDRGLPQFAAVIAATRAVVNATDPLMTLRGTIAEWNLRKKPNQINVFLRHSIDPKRSADLAVSREQTFDERYLLYQQYLAIGLNYLARQEWFDVIIDVEGRTIIDIQDELRSRLSPLLRTQLRSVVRASIEQIVLLAGLSESGKSTLAEMLRLHHGAVRLKIGYLLDIAVSRLHRTNPYEWDAGTQAEALVEELGRFSYAHREASLFSLESARNYDSSIHVKALLGSRCSLVWVDAPIGLRQERDTKNDAVARDNEKEAVGCSKLAGQCDILIRNTGPKFALWGAAAHIANRCTPLTVNSGALDAARGSSREFLAQLVVQFRAHGVHAIIAGGSTAAPWWQEEFSDLDLIVVDVALTLDRLRQLASAIPPLPRKLGISWVEAHEFRMGLLTPHVLYALRSRRILWAQEGLVAPTNVISNLRTDAANLPILLLTLRRLLSSVDVVARQITSTPWQS